MWLLASCAASPEFVDKSKYLAYWTSSDKSRLEQYQPVFIIEEPAESHNRIGTPRVARDEPGIPDIYVDPQQATVYGEVRNFSGDRGSYINLIYRVHFAQVPFSIIPFHLGWGDNVGLITVVTLNRKDEPVLYTTVHACGCYLAFVPTSYLPSDALPPHWDFERQTVLGERLPGVLEFAGISVEQPVTVILVRKNTHRVMDMFLTDAKFLEGFSLEKPPLVPMSMLEHLPREEDEAVSFFEESGPRRGYVKGSAKPLERLLMSWWALDLRVGEDKKFGSGNDGSPVFYTSLKPWDRTASDMRNFQDFLKYWGWGL